MDYSGDSMWFLGIPVIVIIFINLIFLINVIRVIKRKREFETTGTSTNRLEVHNTSEIRTLESTDEVNRDQLNRSTYKAARAALLLIPILGVHFVLFPMRPKSGDWMAYPYEICSCIFSSFQGFFVSLVFCIFSSDVS